MITVASKSAGHYINPTALTFTENYQGRADIVHVSLVQGAAIMVFRAGEEGLGYGADADYQRWRLNGVTVGLNKDGENKQFEIYARLSRTQKEADIIFSLKEYSLRGVYTYVDENGVSQTSDESDDYWYIWIGYLTAPVDGKRTLYYDSGELGTRKAEAEKSELFDFISTMDPPRIEPRYGFSKLLVYGEAIFNSVVGLVKGFTLGGRNISGVSPDEADASKDTETLSNEQIATPRYVQSHGDKRYLNKLTSKKQQVNGSVDFLADLNVAGKVSASELDVSGNATIQGTTDLKGLLTVHGGFQTPNFNNAAGQITGAHLTPDGKLYVSGLKANNFEIDQLIFNVVKAQGGEYVYSTSCEIESCIYVMKDGSQLTPDAFYALDGHDWQQIDHVLITLKEDEFTQYGNPFEEGDIIYGKVNQVQESGKHAIGGECIMHITEVEDNTLNITAELYQVGEHGLVGNIPPIEDMVIAHRGNKDGVQGRTTSFYLSTITGNLVMLYNVTTPTLSAANYGATFGKLPYDLYVQVLSHYAGLQPEDPAVYAKLLVTENWIQMDHLGQPIKFEVYRGDWRYDVAVSDEPYIVTLSTYDTVTHNGAKWRVATSNTEKEPNDTFGDWERITDANITVYTLTPSSNIIYIRDAGVITPSELDVTVKSTTSLGEEIISDQATLVDRNLTVWYTIDGGSERKMLVLGGTKVFVTEDGSSVFFTEDENVNAQNTPLYFEGESIDLMQVADNITLYLVENYPDNPVDRASYVIPVVNDGASPLGLELTPSALSVPVDATTLATAGVRDYESTVRIKQGVSYIDDVSEYTMQLTYTLRSGEVGTSNILDTDYIVDDWSEGSGWKIYVQSGNGIVKNKQIERIDISILHGEAVIATGAILFNYLERGITGPAGKDGPFLYPCGTWQEGAEYKFTYQLDSNGNIVKDSDNNPIIIAKPFVYYKSPEGAENYYVLEKNVPEGSNIAVTNTEYWKPFTKIQYIFTEALMANWARLGGTNGAYFWGNYMFSTRGVDKYGNSIDIPAFAEEIFTDGKLNGTITPNIFFDFHTGAAKMNMISEPLTPMEAGVFAHVIDPKRGHNLTIRSEKGIIGQSNNRPRPCYPKIVMLPEVSDEDPYYDGLRCTIIAEAIPNVDMKTGHTWDSSDSSIGWDTILVCADGRLATLSETVSERMDDGMFCVGGRMAKFIAMEAGSMLHLRCCMSQFRENDRTFTRPIWYVENSSDFEPTNIQVIVDSNQVNTSIHTFDCNYHGWYQQGRYIAMATKYIESVRNGSDGMLSFTYLNTESADNYGDVVQFNGIE